MTWLALLEIIGLAHNITVSLTDGENRCEVFGLDSFSGLRVFGNADYSHDGENSSRVEQFMEETLGDI